MVKNFILYNLLLLSLVLILTILFIEKGYDFLVKNSEISKADIYLVIPTNLKSLNLIAKDLKSKEYNKIVTVGESIDYGSMFYTQSNYSLVNRDELINRGFNANIIDAIEIDNSEKNFAISVAKTIKRELDSSRINIFVKDINSKYYDLAFSKVLKNSDIEYGIIPINSGAYSSNNWFRSSMGIKNIIFSYIRYIYEILN